MSKDYDNHERIWLEPVEPIDPVDGRQWCSDNVWGDGIEYIRADLAPAPVTNVRSGHPAGCLEEFYEGDEVAYLRDKLKEANERDRFIGVNVTSSSILREWFGADRYARDHEYLDANFGKQAQQVVDWLASLNPSPSPMETLYNFTSKAK